MKYNAFVFLFMILIGCNMPEVKTGKPLSYHFDAPAGIWEASFPLGNGRLGLMPDGGVDTENIVLNEISMWSGSKQDTDNPQAYHSLGTIRKLLFEGRNDEAQELMYNTFVCKGEGSGQGQGANVPYGSYQLLGNLVLNYDYQGTSDSIFGYRRELNLDNAIATASFRRGKVTYNREVFTSFADDLGVIHLTADADRALNFSFGMNRPEHYKVTADGNDLLMQGQLPDGVDTLEMKGLRYASRVRVILPKGGNVTPGDSTVSVRNASEAILLVSMATDYFDKDLEGKVSSLLANAEKKDFASLKKGHIAAYRSLFGRVELDLGHSSREDLPMDERLAAFHENPDDPSLAALYFQFGRYLLICSSQPGGQPANLQGIWNDKLFPSWDSKYTCNINLEMNYWPSEVTNLSDLNEPLFRLIKEVSESGKETAKIMYGANGWVLHHNTDIWRITGALDKAPSGMWPSGGAWLCRHLWERYLYTGDTEFLRSVYPILKESGLFFDEIMVKEPVHNWLVVCPSNSPENVHSGSDGKATTAAGCTMDNQLIFDLWTAIISASRILDTDKEFAAHLEQRLKEMAPMQVGHWGQLQEWMFDWDDPNDVHRHVSHLYGLFPSNQISPYRTPELFDAARTSLIHRGDPSTGWSMGWKVCLWARLLDGDHAYKLITDQLTLVRNEKKKGGTYPNLFDAHPPFQIDGNFGCAAGIVEMLMQSYDGFIYLLPALPTLWKDGSVTGIIARGGFELDLNWKNGKVNRLVVKSHKGGNCRLRSLNPLNGKGLKRAKGENPNPLYAVPTIPQPLVNEKASLNKVEIAKTYLYDLPTKAGQEYILIGK